MTNQYTKLMLRGFNGECDAAVANVSWNNAERMEERVRKSFDALNQLGSTMQMSLTSEFLQLKFDELRLTHEYQEKRHQEREEQRRVREQIREEEKAEQELEEARQQAEREEADYMARFLLCGCDLGRWSVNGSVRRRVLSSNYLSLATLVERASCALKSLE